MQCNACSTIRVLNSFVRCSWIWWVWLKPSITTRESREQPMLFSENTLEVPQTGWWSSELT